MAKSEIIDHLVSKEWPEGTSAGAAARQVCRSLDSNSALKRLLEMLLAQANNHGHDRAAILREFCEAAPEAARNAEANSFRRLNNNVTTKAA